MTKNDISDVMKKIPELNSLGIGLWGEDRKLSAGEQAVKLKKRQQELLLMTEECTAVCEWLKPKIRTKTVSNRNPGSYGLKHLAEKEIGYVTNGAFIGAAVFCGFPYKLCAPNVIFGISARSLKR